MHGRNKRLLLFCLLIASDLTVCAWVTAADNAGLTKLAEDVYVRIVSPDGDAVGNAGVLVLDQAVLVFDTHFTPEAGQALLASIRSITSKPVRYVVNSHHHPDHTHGNQVFEQAQILGSTNARSGVLQADVPSLNRTLAIARAQIRKMQADIAKGEDFAREQSYREQLKSRESYVADLSRLHILAPSVTLDDSLTIKDGERQVEIRFLGEGHTDGDVVLVLPSVKIAFAGDLFFNDAIPNVQDANILKWMGTLRDLLKLEADTFVPGHGPVGGRKAVERFLKYFEDLKALVESAVARGDSLEQALQEIRMAKYSAYSFQNFFRRTCRRCTREVAPCRWTLSPRGVLRNLKAGKDKNDADVS
jgi:glyoxylase-like metal-dependent hydrolase (beta-lactamase superfamily II)